jgi:hypothetical protein
MFVLQNSQMSHEPVIPDVEIFMHAHTVKKGFTIIDKHCFCKNLADQLANFLHKKYQLKLEAASTQL